MPPQQKTQKMLMCGEDREPYGQERLTLDTEELGGVCEFPSSSAFQNNGIAFSDAHTCL